MTQAITDIKELVGEMPARGCEWAKFDDPPCGTPAQWVMRVHFSEWGVCHVDVQYFCDEHKRELQDLALTYKGVPCRYCDVPAEELFGPVMPL